MSKETKQETATNSTDIAGMGAWGNYMARHFLEGASLEDLRIEEKEIPRLIEQAKDYENKCVKHLSDEQPDKATITDINQINTETVKGKLLMAALAKITTESQTDKTPYEVLEQLNWLQNEMYPEKK